MNDDKKTIFNKLREWLPQDVNWWMVGVAIAFLAVLIAVMAFDSVSYAFQKWFGTSGKKETLEFLGLGMGGVIALYGLVVLNKRAEAQVASTAEQAKSVAAQVKTNILMEKGHVQDRFKAAAEHLSNDKPSARIASFYEFFHLAKDEKDEKKYTQSILDIFCAHLRHISNPINPEEKPSEEIKTLIGILFSREAVDIFGELEYDLQRVNLNEVDFQKMQKPKGKVNFSFAKLVKANFIKTDLSGFNFQKANLGEADLRGAILEGADLQEAILEGARLWAVNLSGADLREAKLREANLWMVNLSGAWAHGTDLRKANLQEANLREANLAMTKLQEANLRKTDLRETKNLELAVLSEAEYDNETKFPEGFNPAARGMVKRL